MKKKTLTYQGSKLWTEMRNNLKLNDQGHLRKFQVDLRYITY